MKEIKFSVPNSLPENKPEQITGKNEFVPTFVNYFPIKHHRILNRSKA
jgi:hypothetical protein